jgi:hypothetical protein
MPRIIAAVGCSKCAPLPVRGRASRHRGAFVRQLAAEPVKIAFVVGITNPALEIDVSSSVNAPHPLSG